MTKAHLDFYWSSDQFPDDTHATDPKAIMAARKMELFEPIILLVSDELKSKKKRLVSDKRITWCRVVLAATPKPSPSIGLTLLSVEVPFDFDDFLNLPDDHTISGPYVAEKVRASLPLLDATQIVETGCIKAAVDTFERDGFCYRWVIKNAALGKRDFRVKVTVFEYPAYDHVWAELTSDRLGIVETFEVFAQQKRFHQDRALVPATQGHFTHHGGMYNTRHVRVTKDGLTFGTDDPYCFSRTFARGELSDAMCDALGID